MADPTTKYFKIIDPDGHRGVVYKLGLNVDPLPFTPNHYCGQGAIYFTTFEHISQFFSYGTMLAEVEPRDKDGNPFVPICNQHSADGNIATTSCDKCDWCFSFKAPAIYIHSMQPIADAAIWDDPHHNLRAVSTKGVLVRFIRNQTPDICIAAVKNDHNALQYVHDQTVDICLTAVETHFEALRHIMELSPSDYERVALAAIASNWQAMQYVAWPFYACTDEATTAYKQLTAESLERICLAAVHKSGHALKYIAQQGGPIKLTQAQIYRIYLAAVNQTGQSLQYLRRYMAAQRYNSNDRQRECEQLCIAAINQNVHAFHCIKPCYQSPDICLAAVRGDGSMLRYVEAQSLIICEAAVAQDKDAVRFIRDGRMRAMFASGADALVNPLPKQILDQYHANKCVDFVLVGRRGESSIKKLN